MGLQRRVSIKNCEDKCLSRDRFSGLPRNVSLLFGKGEIVTGSSYVEKKCYQNMKVSAEMNAILLCCSFTTTCLYYRNGKKTKLLPWTTILVPNMKKN